MAQIEFKGLAEYEQALAKLGDSYDKIIPRVIKAGCAVVEKALQSGHAIFGKFAKAKAPKKNKLGWFAQVQFKGKTRTGEPAALAVTINEYGRKGGKTYQNRYGTQIQVKPQPARPWVKKTIAVAEEQAAVAMQTEYDKAVSEIWTQ